MKFRLVLAITFALCVSSTLFAQPTEQHKLVQFQMAIMKRGPAWDSTKAEDRNSILHQHLGNVIALLDSGKVIIAGPFDDSSDVAGIFIFRTASANEAKALVDTDPAVKAGFMIPEMRPWSLEDIFKKPVTSLLTMETVFLVFLKICPNRKEGDGEAHDCLCANM